jgi:hypothetical protein
MPRIAILTQRRKDFPKRDYVLHAVSRLWERRGIEVAVLDGPDADGDADLAILHVNQTVVPPEYDRLISRFPRVLNARVRDISKRVVSCNLVRRGDDLAGPVIVKTDLNHGGVPESRIVNKMPTPHRWWRAGVDRLPWRRPLFEGINYPLFERSADVPRRVWSDRRLVVERFLPERDDGFYCVRIWMFLGAKERIRRFFSRDPVIKSTNIVHAEQLADVPDELRRLREAWGFDFGKFDFAMCDGRLVVYDLNRTPSLGRLTGEAAVPLVDTLADGIGSYL